MKKTFSFFLIFSFLFISLCACGQNPTIPYGDDDLNNVRANSAMGINLFDMRDDFVYFTDHSDIYEYDMRSGKTIRLGLNSKFILGDLNVHYRNITYSTLENGVSGIGVVSRDGKTVSLLPSISSDSAISNVYIENDVCYYKTNGELIRQNINSEKREILVSKDFLEQEGMSLIITYYVSDDSIYLSTYPHTEDYKNGEPTALYVSSKDEIDFKKIPIEDPNIKPNQFLLVDDILYVCRTNPFALFTMKTDGTFIEDLPISSPNFRVLDNFLYYIDITNNTLNSYNLETGEIRQIIQGSFDEFSLLQDRYIGAWSMDAIYLYDIQTGESVNMIADECWVE